MEPVHKPSAKEMLRRETPRYAGVYVDGQIQGVEVTFTVDTGASTTIVASRVYDKMHPSKRPSIQVSNPVVDLVGADGSSLSCKGRAVFEIDLGPLRLVRELAVATIADEALLGADILQGDQEGPADLLLSEDRMVFRNTSIPIQQVRLPRRKRYARVADHYVIPGMSQMFVEVFLDPPAQQRESSHQVLLETKPSLIEDCSVLLAPTVLDTRDRGTGSIALMNPFTHPVSIKQDQVVASIEEIDGVNNVLLCEDGCDPNTVLSTKEGEKSGYREGAETADSIHETSCTADRKNCDSMMATNCSCSPDGTVCASHKSSLDNSCSPDDCAGHNSTLDDCIGSYHSAVDGGLPSTVSTNQRESE